MMDGPLSPSCCTAPHFRAGAAAPPSRARPSSYSYFTQSGVSSAPTQDYCKWVINEARDEGDEHEEKEDVRTCEVGRKTLPCLKQIFIRGANSLSLHPSPPTLICCRICRISGNLVSFLFGFRIHDELMGGWKGCVLFSVLVYRGWTRTWPNSCNAAEERERCIVPAL